MKRFIKSSNATILAYKTIDVSTLIFEKTASAGLPAAGIKPNIVAPAEVKEDAGG
jgi:hypothetical protein